jgi:hypothetical protein
MTESTWPVPNAADVQSVESIIAAFDAALTFEPGGAPNYQRLKSLFLPVGNLVSPKPWNMALDVDGFLRFVREALPELKFDQTGFAERNQIVKRYTIGGVNAVFAHYTLHSPATAKDAFAQGINMFHIVEFDGKFAIASCVWEDESESAPTPADLRPR